MVYLNRRLLGAVAVLLACAVAWAWVHGTDRPAGPGPDDDADPEAARGRKLVEAWQGVKRRIAEKERLAREVAEGRLGLLEAAARFRDLDRQPPEFHWEAFRRTVPGASDEERHCREVIGFVRGLLLDQPGADAAVPYRLEAELRARLDRGDLSLPEE
jgi:hypothetical protein